MLKKIFLSLFIILIALLSIALYRTFTHLAYDVGKIEGEIISIDKVKASQNLAASIRFKTISYQDKEKFPDEEFNNFIKWAAATYPEFHHVMEIDQLEHSLLFKGKAVIQRWLQFYLKVIMMSYLSSLVLKIFGEKIHLLA